MGGRDPGVRRGREGEMTVIYAVMGSILLLIVVQFLLLVVAVEGFLGGRPGLLAPAAAGSGLCFAGACWLVRYLSSPRSRDA